MIDPVTWWREGRPILPLRWTHDENWDLTWVAKVANAYNHHTRWFRPYWWAYIWRAPEHWRGKGTVRVWRGYYADLNPWRVRWCRLKGHPNGYVYYSSGEEPDYSCKDCGEIIG